MPARLRQAEQELLSLAGIDGLGSFALATTVEDAVRSADMVVDFVPDELESKLEIFSMADRMAPPRTILCTPTLALSIADLASCVYRPELCVAVEGVAEPEVRLVSPAAGSPQMLDAVGAFFRSLGRSVVFAEDTHAAMLTKVIFQR